MKTKLLLIIFVAGFLTALCNGQENENDQTKNQFDVIPANAKVGLAWPRVTQLGPKAHKLAQEVYPGSGQFIKRYAGSFFTDAGIDYESPRFLDSIERDNPGAILGVKVESNYYQINVLPVGDLKTLASLLEANIFDNSKSVDLEKLKSGEIVEVNRRLFVKYSDGFIYSSSEIQALAAVDLSSPIRESLTENQQSQFLSSDALLFLDDELAVEFLDNVFGAFGDLSWLNTPSKDGQANEFTELLAESGKEFAFGLAGFELDDGLGIRYTNFFNEVKDSHVQKLIESIRGGDGASNLNHLPNDNFIAAFAARGTGKKNAMAAKAILRAIVNRVSPGEEVLSAKDKPVFYESFAKIWQQLNGSRVAIYRIESDKAIDGNLSAVAIFDVADPGLLLSQLPELVRFANESAERNTAEEDLLPIRFSYQPDAMKINGHRVDILDVDTDRLNENTRKRFRLLFGENAKQFKFVAVKNHVLMLVGTNTELLVQTIENLENEDPGLTLHPAIVSANKRIDARRKIEAHFSFQNLVDVYTFKVEPKPFVDSDDVSSLAITIETDRVGIDSWFPIQEIDTAVDWIILW